MKRKIIEQSDVMRRKENRERIEGERFNLD